MDTYQTIQQRRTIRRFGQQPLTAEQLRRYVDAARLAPSGANLQPLKYVIIQTKEIVDQLFGLVHWAAYLAPEGTPGLGERPTAYIAQIVDLKIKQAGYELDAGAAMENLLLAAEDDGVGCCWMGSVDYVRVSELLGLKETEKLIGIVSMGRKAERPVEDLWQGSVKYYKDENGVLHVPKRPLEEIILREM